MYKIQEQSTALNIFACIQASRWVLYTVRQKIIEIGEKKKERKPRKWKKKKRKIK